MSVCTCGNIPEVECKECYTFLCGQCGAHCIPCNVWTCVAGCDHSKCISKTEKRGTKRKLMMCDACGQMQTEKTCDDCLTLSCSDCEAQLDPADELPACPCGPLCGDCKHQCEDCGEWCCSDCGECCALCGEWCCRDKCVLRNCM